MDAFRGKFPLGLQSVSVGSTDDRSFCEQIQFSASAVHVSMSGRKCGRNRRTSSALAKRSPLLFSTDHDYGRSHSQNSTRATRKTSSGRPKLAKHSLEFYTKEDLSAMATDPEHQSVAANVEVETSVPSFRLFGSVAHKLPRLTDRGYSSEVLNHLHRSRLHSTNLTYESKWKLFASYCSNLSTDPFMANSAIVANFLVKIAKDRSLAHSTICGYRSAISRVILLTTGEDLSTCPILNQLMQSLKRTQPIQSRRIPTWDISVVIDFLLSQDNYSCDIKILTMKFVFLLALASGDRRSAIASLSRSKIKLTRDSVVIPYVDDFIPKSYFLRKNCTKIRDLSLPFIPDKHKIDACPAATTLAYIDRTDQSRSRDNDNLLIKHSNSKPMNGTSVSFYIKECISASYDHAGLSTTTGRAHDVRKIAAALRSLTNPSLNDVLISGEWLSANTYFKHYFLKINNVFCSTGRSNKHTVVAGRKKVSFSLQENN